MTAHENFPSNNESHNFREPTPETRERFQNALESLKRVAVGVVYNRSAIVMGDDMVIPPNPLPEGLGPIKEYSYAQSSDPLFDKDEQTNLKFAILEADDETFQKWFAVEGDRIIWSVYYTNGDTDFHYSQSLSSENLQVTKHINIQEKPGSAEWRARIYKIMEELQKAKALQSSGLTNESLLKLAIGIEQEVAKRVL